MSFIPFYLILYFQVKRKTPLLPYDVDARTVYVESIPVKATQEWLKKVFSNYGHVAYISLPKFRNTQRIKVRLTMFCLKMSEYMFLKHVCL